MLTRRTFVGTMSAAALGAAMGLIGCASNSGATTSAKAPEPWTVDDFISTTWTIAKEKKADGDWNDYKAANTLKFLENKTLTFEGPSFGTQSGNWRWDEATKQFTCKFNTGKYWLICEKLPEKSAPTVSFVVTAETGSALEIVRESDAGTSTRGNSAGFANPTILDNEYVTINVSKLYVDNGRACFAIDVKNNCDTDFFLSESDLYINDEKASIGVLPPGTISLKAGKKGTFNFYVVKSDGSYAQLVDELYTFEGSYTIYGEQNGQNVSLGNYAFTFANLNK